MAYFHLISFLSGILFWNTIIKFSNFHFPFFLGLLVLSFFLYLLYRKQKETKYELYFLAYTFFGAMFLAEFSFQRLKVLEGVDSDFYKWQNVLLFGYIGFTGVFLVFLRRIESNWKTPLQKIFFNTPLLLQILFLFYLHCPNNLTSIDTKFARLAPYSLVLEGNLDLNEFFGDPKLISVQDAKPKPAEVIEKWSDEEVYVHSFILLRVKDKFFTLYPIVVGFLSTIVYSIIWVLGFPISIPASPEQFRFLALDIGESYALERIAASLIATATSFFFFLIARKFTRKYSALLLTILFSLGTSHYTISSQALWQHSFVEFLFLIIYYLILQSRKGMRLGIYGSLIGLLVAITFFVRGTTFILLLFIGLEYLYYSYKNRNIKFLLYPLLTALPVMLLLFFINWNIYENPFGGYAVFFAKPENAHFFNNSYIFQNFIPILFSPSRGIFIFFPYFLVLIFLAFYYRYNFRIWIFLAIIFTHVLFFSRYSDWHGAWNYGPRMMTEIMPVFLLLFLVLWKKIYTSKMYIKLILLFLSVLSIIIQILGTYAEKNSFLKWHSCNRYSFQEMANDWENMQMFASIRTHYPKFFSGYTFKAAYSCSNGTPVLKDKKVISVMLDSESPLELPIPTSFLPEKVRTTPIVLMDEFYAGNGTNCLEINWEKPSPSTKTVLYLQKGTNILEIPTDSFDSQVLFEFQAKSRELNSILFFAQTTEPILWESFRVWKGNCP